MTPLIHWDFSGKSNVDAGTIVEDLTGNGYDLELKNFAFDNESGYNGYPTDFRKWNIWDYPEGGYDALPVTTYENKVIFRGTIREGFNSCGILNPISNVNKILVLKISGLKENQVIYFFNYSISTVPVSMHNGINIVDGTQGTLERPDIYITYTNTGTSGKDIDATIEIFPLYPDQLVFNGINNFCQCTKDFVLPISRGYTWIAKYKNLIRLYFVGKGADAYNNTICIVPSTDGVLVYSYGINSEISREPFYNNGLSYGTSRFAGKQDILKGTVDDTINNKFVLGTIRPTEHLRYFKGTISEFYLFDRDLTQSQIEKFISDNMIPLPEVYYDVEKQGTLNEHTTKDKLIDFSGNQHHGTLHNFTFDETNGWGYYSLNTVPCDERATINTVVINGNSTGVIAYNQRLNINAENFTQDTVIPEFRVKVTGLSAIKETQPNAIISFVDVFINDGGTNTSHIYFIEGTTNNEIKEDGIYTVPSHTVLFSNKQDITSLVRLCDLCWSHIINDGSVNITVEFLPIDEDCLRFDADNDTNVTLDNVTEGFKTVFAQIMPVDMGETDTPGNGGGVYDQRVINGPNTFAIYGYGNSIAWNARNSGVTYINGELNTTTKVSELDKIRHNITIVNEDVTADNSANPKIGILVTDYAGNFKLYKFLGFKEALSEKQIKMVIEKYGLQIN